MSTYVLVSTRKLPPGGFSYRCPVCGFKVKNYLAPWREVVREIQIHRRNNPTHKLSWDIATVERDLEIYTCNRLHNSSSYCRNTSLTANELAEQKPARKGCSTCGRGKKSG